MALLPEDDPEDQHALLAWLGGLLPSAPKEAPSSIPWAPGQQPTRGADVPLADTWLDKGLDVVMGALGVPVRESKSAAAGELLSMLPVAGMVKGGLKAVQAAPEGAAVAKEALKRILNPIKAHHGSPHDFGEVGGQGAAHGGFDISKLGTGEGAQAYGHGLYFADKEGTAKFYRDNLSKSDLKVNGKLVPADAINTGESPRDMAMLDLAQGRDQRATIAGSFDKRWADEYLKAFESLQGKVELASPGKMYEVNIHADPDEMLDWDAPLSQQSEKVQKSLGFVPRNIDDEQVSLMSLLDEARRTDTPLHKLPRYKELEQGLDTRMPDMTGAEAYFAQGFKDKAENAKALREKGIPGIKYYDATSRGAKEGTRNYVIFDDKLIEIVKKYGIAGAVSAGLLSEAQAEQMKEQGYQ